MNPIRQAFVEGRPTFGLSSKLPTTVGSEILGAAGFDWVMLDQQHGMASPEQVVSSIQALALGGTPALVRVGWNDPRRIMAALDYGAAGVVVPMVSTPDEARAAAAAARYPPEGIRSWGPIRPSDSRDDPLCVVMIETVTGIEHVDEIAAVPGIDGLHVGPVDLAQSMGCWQDEYTIHPRVLEAMDAVIAACRRHGAIPCVSSLAPEYTEDLVRRGMRLVTVNGDTRYLARGARQDLADIRSWADRYVIGDGAA